MNLMEMMNMSGDVYDSNEENTVDKGNVADDGVKYDDDDKPLVIWLKFQIRM